MKYSILYLETTLLAEPIKYLLQYGKLDWEEQPKVTLATWAEVKPSLPFGKLPTVEVDGQLLHQHAAICRHLARKVGLIGKSEWDQVHADIIVDTVNDLRSLIYPFYTNPNKEEAAKYLEAIRANQVPTMLKKLDDIVKNNGGYFVNNQLTWADIYFVSLDQFHNFLSANTMSDYEHLDALKTKVESIPEIKSYIDSRPYRDYYTPDEVRNVFWK